jgi:hypothetical protein
MGALSAERKTACYWLSKQCVSLFSTNHLRGLEMNRVAVGLREGGAVGREHVRCLLGEGGREVGGSLELHGAAPGRPHAAQAAEPLMAIQTLLGGKYRI